MRTTLSALALALAGSSVVSADSQSYLPSIRVRNLGMKAVHKARSKVANDRKLSFDDWGNLTMADIDMSSMGSMICPLLELMDDFQQGFDDELADTNITCTQFGCDENAENLIMECSMNGTICQDGLNDGEVYCIEDILISMGMGLNFTGTSETTATQTAMYVDPSPAYMVGEATFTIGFSTDYGALMTDAISGNMNDMQDVSTMTEEEIEEAANAALKYFDLTECSGEFANGDISCECNLCDDIMMGVNLTCASDTENYYTQDCTDVSSNAMDANAITTGGSPADVAVFKLMKADATGDIVTETDTNLGGATDTLEEGDETSAAASKGALATVGLILAVASLGGLV